MPKTARPSTAAITTSAMTVSATAPCLCVATSNGTRVRIDSSGCQLSRILQSFQEVVRRADELSLVKARTTSAAEGTSSPPRARRRISSGGIARLVAATRQVDCVLEEEGIPHGPLVCYTCQRPIEEGEIRTLHGACDEQRFTDTVDLHALKDVARRSYPTGHPVRELVMAMDDRVAKVEVPLVARLILRLSD